MNPRWEYQLPAVDMGAERFSHVLDKGIAPFGRQASDFLCHGQSGEMTGDELRRQRELCRLDCWTHMDVSKAGRGDEAMQLGGVMERMGRSGHGACFGAQVSRQRLGEDRMIGCVVHSAPHREGEPTSETENTTHLAQRLDAIGEELHPLLTEDHFEDTVLEWQGRGISGSPLDSDRCMPT